MTDPFGAEPTPMIPPPLPERHARFVANVRAMVQRHPTTNWCLLALPPGVSQQALEQYAALLAQGIPMLQVPVQLPDEEMAAFRAVCKTPQGGLSMVDAALEGIRRALKRTPRLVLPGHRN